MRTLWHGARLAPMTARARGAGGDGSPGPGEVIAEAAIVTDGEQVAWAGPQRELPAAMATAAGRDVDLHGALVTPGLIDCHTHLVYAGSRAREFSLRLHGAGYEDIARAGGGILSTVAATRQAGEDELLELARLRLQRLIAEGVTAVEIKSGYGLSLQDEGKMLRVARRLGEAMDIDVRATYLAAHALPPEFAGRADDYIGAVVDWLGELSAQGLVDAVDVFCDRIGFTVEQTRRVFEAARRLGLPVKLHAEQLSNQHGAALAAGYGALSCDHLEHLDESGVQAMKAAGSVAVLLPGAFYFLRDTRVPPVGALRAAGVPIAIATDHNPGSSPLLSMQLLMNMACVLFRLTPEEALAGLTVHAAQALGLASSHGVVAAGRRADFAVWDAEDVADLAYFVGRPACRMRVRRGQLTKETDA